LRTLALSALVTIAAPARGEYILHREVLAHKRFRVELRPFPGGDGDLGELLARGVVLVHLAGCGQGIHADGVARIVRRLVRVSLRACDETPLARALRRPVGNEDDLAEPGDYCGGVQEGEDERGAANARRVRLSWSYIEILAGGLSFPLSQYVEDPPERDADPVRAVVQFVTELMESLLDSEEFDQGSRVLLVLGIGGGTARAFGVPIKEGSPRASLQ
jgi:hypothetical protein